MNCYQVEDLLPAYSLGALEADDRQAVGVHLESCPYCEPIARQYLESTTALGLAEPPATPPPMLRERILAGLLPRESAASDRGFPATVSYGDATRRRWPGVLAVAATASVAMLLIGVLLGMALDMRGEVRDLRTESQQLVSMINDQRTFAYAIALPGTEPMLLEATDQAPKARGMLVVSQDHTWGVLVSQGLEKPSESMGYQLWLFHNSSRVSGGVFTVDDTGYGLFYVKFPGRLDDFSSIGITQEPVEGSAGPTGIKVLGAQMR